MKSSHRRSTFIVAALSIATNAGLLLVRGDAYVCDIVACTNGLFNQAKCKCECIPPYCPDQFGACQSLAGNCGGNPWEECVMGVNCPWWVNKLKDEGCTTGPVVPPDLWIIYNTKEACCAANFPFSSICDPAEPNPPTKFPTIVPGEDDDFDIVPLQVTFSGLPPDISMGQLKDELVTVLRRILLRLADSLDGLEILSIDERVMATLLSGEEDNKNGEKTLYYNVRVRRVEGKKFGPPMITKIRDSYDEILSQIQTFSDTGNLGADLKFNVCTLNMGAYDLCAFEEVVTPAPRPAPVNTATGESGPDDGGLAGWAIALIVVLVLSLLCCGGYAIAVLCFGVTNCFKDPDEPKEIQNNLYMDNRHLPIDYEKRLAIMDGGRSEAGGTRLAIMDGASRASAYNYSVRSGPSRRTIANETQIVTARSQDPSFITLSTAGSRRRQARDPTMFIPGSEDRPDPGSVASFRTRGGESTSSSRRYHSDGSQLKPKREPTMYVDGKAAMEYPASKYLQTPISYQDEFSVEEDSYAYNVDGRYGIDRNADYNQSEPAFTRKSTAEYEQGQYDTSSYDEVESCRTREPSISTAKSKKSEVRGHQNSFRTRDPSVSGKSDFSRQSHWSKVSKSSGVYSG